MKVLIVDDNTDARLTLVMAVELLGHEVCHASDGREALKCLEEFQPDLGILDLGMPHLDGFGLARAIRADERHRHVRLVALSGWSSVETRASAMEAGFDGTLTKPISMAALEALLQPADAGLVRRNGNGKH